MSDTNVEIPEHRANHGPNPSSLESKMLGVYGCHRILDLIQDDPVDILQVALET